ncbi:MAG: ABC transporter permease [Parachlamydiaceae bacterium]
MWNRIVTLIWKEFLAVLRDPKSRISIFMPPIIQLIIFTFAATLDVKNVPIGILNQDSGQQSIELIQRFHGSPMFQQIVFLKGVEEIAPFIDNQRGLMVVSFTESFSRLLNAGKPADIQLILDGRRSNSAQIVSGYVSTIVQQFNTEFAAKARLPHQNAQLFPRNWFNPNLLYHWYNIPSLVATLSMLTCLIVTTQSVARERELGTFDQLLVSPLVPIEILIGKIVPGIIIGMIEGSLMMTAGVFILGVPFTGSIFVFYIALFIFVTAISGVGLFISSLSATQQQGMLGTFVFMMPSILLSGFATPIENMPTWLQPVTYTIPLTYMLVISKGIFLKAMPASIVFENIWPMVIIGFFTIVGAGWFFRRRLS